jgi:hypothetical protein
MRAGTRAPELRPAAAAGLGVPAVRTARLTVRDGAVLVRDGSGREEQLCDAAAVTAALYLEPQQARDLLGRGRGHGGLLVLVSGLEPLVAVDLHAVDPPGPHPADEARFTSGAAAVAGALGLPLEPHDPAAGVDLSRRSVDAVLVDLAARPRPARGRLVACLALSALLALMALVAATTWVGALLTGLAAAALVPVVRAHDAARREADTHLRHGPAPDGRSVWRPVPRVAVRRWVADSELQLGPRDVVRRQGWTEAWVPGPAVGGVVRVTIAPDLVRFLDADDRLLLFLRSEHWCGTPESRQALGALCRDAGLDVVDVPVELADAQGGAYVDVLDGSRASALTPPAQRGDLTPGGPSLLTGVLVLLLVAALATVGAFPFAPLLLTAVVAAVGAPVVRHAVRRWSLDRHVKQLVPPS